MRDPGCVPAAGRRGMVRSPRPAAECRVRQAAEVEPAPALDSCRALRRPRGLLRDLPRPHATPWSAVGLERSPTPTLLTWSLVPAFASVFPLLFEAIGLFGPGNWAWSSGRFAVLLVADAGEPHILAGHLSSEDRLQLSTTLWRLGPPGNLLLTALLIGNIRPRPSPRPIVFAISCQLALATALSVRLLLMPWPSFAA